MLLTEVKLDNVMLPYLLIPQPPAFQREAAHLPRYPTSPLWEGNRGLTTEHHSAVSQSTTEHRVCLELG